MATKSSTNSNARTRATASKNCGGKCDRNRVNKSIESGTEMCSSSTRANSSSTRAKSSTKSCGNRNARNSRTK